MKNPTDSFLKGRLRSLGFSIKGMWLLITTEDSIKAQFFLAILVIVAGFYFDISSVEWMLQIMAIGMVLAAEAVNTAIEKLSDFIHPEYHDKIGFIKDISAGAPGFAAICSLLIVGIIYVPKIMGLL